MSLLKEDIYYNQAQLRKLDIDNSTTFKIQISDDQGNKTHHININLDMLANIAKLLTTKKES
jgi:hypothetical protein